MENSPENIEVTLDKASMQDVDTFLALERKVSGLPTYSPTLSEEEMRRDLETGVAYLIKHENTPIGSIMYDEKGDVAYISYMVVDPAYQGRGVARKALISVLEELKGKRRIELVTHPDNAKALKLYQSLGFIVEGRKENYYGDGEPRLMLVKENQT
ncbi:hypothetical protein A2765_03920 [Candidatus Kaiserbacteria bacterium RIFCSPHIGHO2_01_FULL_56_24]|uniref:N-acetyltransferase domain-containing protein n=1 Tax=Candidatus Kaiserbacteria bacterium RIFCSPHIGHO2_01_FULL_56_24 TaxID=1798487 RepID=A0A1F6DE60_9BACT|nr:MAG: hypothetical protein A2765_03920 [Candidatus Kaiserbacteria bacterium RIFCSPHIGHO2_01_FULL_56_24]